MAATQGEHLPFRRGCWKKPSPGPSPEQRKREAGNQQELPGELSTQAVSEQGLQPLHRLGSALSEMEGGSSWPQGTLAQPC